MPEYCCCCCTLSAGTKISLTICGVEAIIGILWNTELLMLLYDDKKFNPLQMVINVHMLDDYDVVHALTLAALGLNVIWLLATVIAARGNITLSSGQLAFWDLWTYFVALFDTVAAIYFTIKAQAFFGESRQFYLKDVIPTKALTYLSLLVISSKGLLFVFLNIFFAHIAQRRGKEIRHDKSDLVRYIQQHISRCRATTDEALPAYTANPYSSCRSNSNESSFSLSYDAMKGMNSDPSAGNRTIRLSIDMARQLSRNPSRNSQAANVETLLNSSIH